MTDLATPGEVDAEVDSTSTGHAIGKAGTGAWIVDGVDLAGIYTSLDETALNAFNYNTTATSGLDAVIDPGEAYVSGWLCRDTQTTVTLPASDTVDVYVGYDASAILSSGTAPADNENIIVGLDGDFAAEDPRVHIWTFSTDSTSILDNLDRRQLQKPIEFSPTGGLTANANLTIGGSTTFNSAIDIEAANSHIGLNETDESQSWTVESQTGNFQVTEVGVDTHLRIDPSDGGRVEHPNGGAFGDIVTFNDDISLNGRADIDHEHTHLRLYETDTSAQWNIEVSADNLNLFDANNAGHIRAEPGGDVEIRNGTLTNERGQNVYTGDPDQGHIFNGSSSPADSLGRDGDIFVEY